MILNAVVLSWVDDSTGCIMYLVKVGLWVLCYGVRILYFLGGSSVDFVGSHLSSI